MLSFPAKRATPTKGARKIELAAGHGDSFLVLIADFQVRYFGTIKKGYRMESGTKFKSLQPLVPAPDVDKAVSFYCESLGFQKAWVDAKPANLAILYRGEVQVFLSKNPSLDHAKWTSLRVSVENIEGLYAEYSAKEVVHPNGKLNTKPWGLKEFAILDLNGVCFTFHESPKQEKADAQPLNPAIETDRLRLLPISPDHITSLHAIYSNPEAMTYWHTPVHASLEISQQLLKGYIATKSAWAIELKDNREIIGLANCHSLEESKLAGMGYILAPAYQGKGFAKEASLAAIKHLFTNLNVPQIELWIYDDNAPSIRLAKALNFNLDRSFERSGPDGVSRKKTGVFLLKQSSWWKSQK